MLRGYVGIRTHAPAILRHHRTQNGKHQLINVPSLYHHFDLNFGKTHEALVYQVERNKKVKQKQN